MGEVSSVEAAQFDWLSASDAIDRLEHRLGGRSIAKATLAELLRDGKLDCKIDHVFVCGMRDLDNVFSVGLEDGEHVAYDLELGLEEWRESIQWIDDISQWRWPESQFFVTTKHVPLVRNCFDGVNFLLSDIEALEDGAQVPGKSKGAGGRIPDLKRWEAFWMEVVQIACDGNLRPGQISSQAKLREDILSEMKKDPFSEEAIKDVVRRIWKRFFEEV